MKHKAIIKFWNSIKKTNFCWEWTGFLDKNKLPVIRISNGIINGKQSLIGYSPRRLSLELNGQTLKKSDRVKPLICKNKLCVNPQHLLFGDKARFHDKLLKLSESNGGCWVWIASQDKDLYGKYTLYNNGIKTDIRAHVFAWTILTERPVPKGLIVCHTCDHPYCVNPAHLFLGTHLDNARDKVQKARQAKGETSGASKLTNEKVIEIRNLFATNKYTKTQLAKMYNVSANAIYNIVMNKTWKHII